MIRSLRRAPRPAPREGTGHRPPRWIRALLLLTALGAPPACDPGDQPAPAPPSTSDTPVEAAGSASAAPSPDGLRGTPIPGDPPAPDLVLPDQHGRPFDLAQQRGRVVLLFFGFVHCPDVCPAALSTWARMLDALGDDASRVRCVFVTVDPQRDTPERLAGHLAIYADALIGLTADEATLAPVWDGFGIHREVLRIGEHDGAYLVDHSTEMVLVDGEGRQRVRHGFDAELGDVLHDIKRLLP